MKRNAHAAVYPALATHKGTLLRLLLELEGGDTLMIEPLHLAAGGIALRREGLALFGRRPHEDQGMYVLGLDGSIVRHLAVDADRVSSASTFVIYPNGFTFEGRVFDAKELRLLHALVWSTDLARMVATPYGNEIFKFGADWPEVPTIVGLPSKTELDGLSSYDSASELGVVTRCPHIEHSCPNKCDDRTKRIEREQDGRVL